MGPLSARFFPPFTSIVSFDSNDNPVEKNDYPCIMDEEIEAKTGGS